MYNSFKAADTEKLTIFWRENRSENNFVLSSCALVQNGLEKIEKNYLCCMARFVEAVNSRLAKMHIRPKPHTYPPPACTKLWDSMRLHARVYFVALSTYVDDSRTKQDQRQDGS